MLDARTVTAKNALEISEWCGGQLVGEHDALDHAISWPGINVQCGDEVKRASIGSTVLQNHDGTFDVLT